MAINMIGNSGTARPLPAPTSPQGAGAPTAAAQEPTVASTPAPQQPSQEQVQKAVESMKQMVRATAASKLDFSIDGETGKTVVRVTDAETGEMIRQIPSEELLEIARSLDRLQGLMLKDKA